MNEETIREKIAHIFALFDWNGDKEINLAEFQAVVSSAWWAQDREATREEMQKFASELFERADLDGNGGIDVDEFSLLVEQHPDLLDAV